VLSGVTHRDGASPAFLYGTYPVSPGGSATIRDGGTTGEQGQASAVWHAPDGEIVLRASPNGGESAVIEISDRGPGIPADVRARVFDRFFTGGPERDGFGLGLAIARDSTAAMHGRLELDSSPEGGTTARVVLQRA
jgi:C4-dicarboxylate-specific signal transduction histidine kinase